MSSLPSLIRHPSALLGLTAALLLSGCQVDEKTIEAEDSYFKEEPRRVPETHRNRLAGEPTVFLRSRSSDPVHWQPWSAELFEHARQEQKPVFALVAGGNHARSRDVLDRLSADPQAVRLLHGHYLCTLVDINAHPEMGLLAFYLSRDSGRAVAFPLLAWLTHEGNSFASLPLQESDAENFASVLANSHAMVRDRWEDNPRYVINNSRRENETRSANLASLRSRHLDEQVDLRASLHNAARELTALYDPISRQIDGSGGLVPFSVLQFAAAVAADPSTPSLHRDRLLEMARGQSALIRASAIHDPLDGGYFYARQSRFGWSLPVFVKDSATQLEGVIAFSRLAGLLERESHVAAAEEVLGFAERRFGDDPGGIGLYEFPPSEAQAADAFLWAQDRLRQVLPEEEAAVAEVCYGLEAIGNIPLEADLRRDYFRLNSLRRAKSVEEAAAELGLPVARVRDLLESARQRLLVRRRELVTPDEFAIESTRVTANDARLVSALVAYHRATGDAGSLARARAVLERLREVHYTETDGLMRIPEADGHRGVSARGLDYAFLLEALFDLYRSDLDPAHLAWAEALAREAVARLADEEGLLREAPVEDRLQSVPVYSETMVFGPSTWGAIFGPLARLEMLTGSGEFARTVEEIARRLSHAFEEIPIQHTDFGANLLVAVTATVVCLDGPREDERFAALWRVLQEPRFAAVTPVHLSGDLPAGFELPASNGTVRALVLRDGMPAGEALDPAELDSLLAPDGHPE